MKPCAFCGKDVDDSAQYCMYCGNPVGSTEKEEYKVDADDLVKTVKHLLHEGNIRRILIKDEEGNRLLEIPVTIGVIGAVIAPWLAALGAVAAIATKCPIEIIRVDSQ